jgi:competence protein ComEC
LLWMLQIRSPESGVRKERRNERFIFEITDLQMNRPLVFIAITYICGIVLSEIFKISLPFAFVIFIIVSVLAVIFRRKTDKTILAIFAALGLLLYSFQAAYFPKNHIKNYNGLQTIKESEILVDTMPEMSDDKTYFTGSIMKLYNKTGEISGITGKVRVTIDKNIGERVQYGDILRIKGWLREPAGPKNPGEFDYKKYLRYKGVYCTVYAKGQGVEKTGVKINNYFFYYSLKAKDKLLQIIYSSLPDAEARVLDGLMLGNQRAIPADTYDKFKITGTVHILAVSGMNVGLIALFLFLFLKILRVKRKLSAVITLVFIAAFAVVTGAGASIVRAAIMSCIVLFGLMLERDVDIYSSLSAAALLILFFNPADLFDIGFQLSFLATLGIVYYVEWLGHVVPEAPEMIKATVITTVAAQVFLTPVMANTFHQVSLISVLANLFVVPLSGMISILGFVMWMLGALSASAAKIFGASIWLLIKIMNFFVDVMASVPYAAISVRTLPAVLTCVYYLFFLVLPHEDIDTAIFKISGKQLLGAALCVMVPFHLLYHKPGASLSVLAAKDVHAAYFKTADNKKILFLACDDYEKSAGVRSVVAPFLRFEGVNNIDRLVLYSMKNGNNMTCLKRNFVIKKTLVDGNYQAGSYYERIGNETGFTMDSYSAELEHKRGTIIFTKLLAGSVLGKHGCVIYTCFYSDRAISAAAKDNFYIINSGTIKGFGKRKNPESPDIWDVGEKGAYDINL